MGKKAPLIGLRDAGVVVLVAIVVAVEGVAVGDQHALVRMLKRIEVQ